VSIFTGSDIEKRQFHSRLGKAVNFAWIASLVLGIVYIIITILMSAGAGIQSGGYEKSNPDQQKVAETNRFWRMVAGQEQLDDSNVGKFARDLMPFLNGTMESFEGSQLVPRTLEEVTVPRGAYNNLEDLLVDPLVYQERSLNAVFVSDLRLAAAGRTDSLLLDVKEPDPIGWWMQNGTWHRTVLWFFITLTAIVATWLVAMACTAVPYWTVNTVRNSRASKEMRRIRRHTDFPELFDLGDNLRRQVDAMRAHMTSSDYSKSIAHINEAEKGLIEMTRRPEESPSTPEEIARLLVHETGEFVNKVGSIRSAREDFDSEIPV